MIFLSFQQTFTLIPPCVALILVFACTSTHYFH